MNSKNLNLCIGLWLEKCVLPCGGCGLDLTDTNCFLKNVKFVPDSCSSKCQLHDVLLKGTIDFVYIIGCSFNVKCEEECVICVKTTSLNTNCNPNINSL